MTSPPLLFTWDGEAMWPRPAFVREANKQFVVGETYRSGRDRGAVARQSFAPICMDPRGVEDAPRARRRAVPHGGTPSQARPHRDGLPPRDDSRRREPSLRLRRGGHAPGQGRVRLDCRARPGRRDAGGEVSVPQGDGQGRIPGQQDGNPRMDLGAPRRRAGDPPASACSMKACSIPSCGSPAKARGWCGTHYMRWHSHGDPNVVIVAKPSAEERAMSMADRVRHLSSVNENGCWLWQRRIDVHGYGRLGKRLAHRLSYEAIIGPIPKGLTLDHLCRTPMCVNPDHLEPVTNRENILRGHGPSALASRATHCKHGHEFSADNTLICRGHRYCRACIRRRNAEWRARRAA